ncbi:MAG TPA: HAMP domain-containing methyl-accepting chemotaxis protein [Stellaceae bacterium]|nr:HAMP domain-containing methyl-accepting chemotaxis protein [Stellaceae bacterium]
MSALFRNLSIRAKIATIPLATTVLLLGLGLYAFLLLKDNGTAIQLLGDSVLRQTVVASDFATETERSLARLYRLTSMSSSDSDAKRISALAKEDTEAMTKFAAKLPALDAALAGAGIAPSRVSAFDAAFNDYVTAAKGVIDVADGDAATALTFMTATQRKFDAVSKQLSSFLDTLAEARDQQLAQIDGEMSRGRMIFAGAIGLVVLAALALAFAISGLISAPMVAMAHAVERIAAKDYTVAVPAVGRRDELGKMAHAIDVLKQQSISADRLTEEQRRSHEASNARRQALEKAIKEFETAARGVVTGVSSAADEMRASAEVMTNTAGQVSRQAAAVAGGSEEASANVHNVASASEELTASITEIGRQSSNSTRIAAKAVADAKATDAKVQSLAEAAQRIGDVVKLISDVAGQTNLLALNATIEAARAGEAGKGFAVVASEVKNLATQTAKATEEIAAQVKSIQEATRESVSSIQSIGGTIAEIDEIATAIAAAVEQQGSATQEIARNIQQAAKSTQEVSANIISVGGATAEAGSAAAHVLGAAEELARQSATLRTQVDTFLAHVRIA